MEKETIKNASGFSALLAVVANIVYTLISDILLLRSHAFIISIIVGILIGMAVSVAIVASRKDWNINTKDIKPPISGENIGIFIFVSLIYVGFLYISIEVVELVETTAPPPIAEFVGDGYIWMLLIIVAIFWTMKPRAFKLLAYVSIAVFLPFSYIYKDLILTPYLGDYTPLIWLILIIIILWITLLEIDVELA